MKDQIKRPVRRKRNNEIAAWQVVLLAIISAIVVVVSFTALFIVLYKPNVETKKPQPPVNYETGGNELVTDDQGNVIGSNETTDPDDTAIRKKDFYTFLVMGRDTVGYNTDIIMLISFDISNAEVSVMQIPRDTYIEVNQKATKINSLYAKMHSAAYNEGSKNLTADAMEDTINLLQTHTGLLIDYYVLVNLEGFRNIIDLIGGVKMDVPYDMEYDDPDQDLYINIKKGYQVLNGEKSEQFIRFRSGYIQGDIGRIDAQKLFMAALIAQLKEEFTADKLLGMAGEALKNVETSMSIPDITYFVKEFYLVDTMNINFINFPGSDVYATASYYIMNRTDTLTLFNRYFNVFTTDIPNERFDPLLIFDQQKTPSIHDIYSSEPVEDILSEYVTNSQSVFDNGLYIPIY